MKMVSVAKLRRVQSGAAAVSAYAAAQQEMLSAARAASPAHENPFLQPRAQIKRICCVLLVGNRGLCGNYNQELVRYARTLYDSDPERVFFWVVGRWGADAIRDAGVPVERRLEGGDAPTPEEAQALTALLKELYLSGGADEVRLVYQQYRSVLVQTPGELTLLPAAAEASEPSEPYLFEPSPEAVLDALVESELPCRVYAALRECRMGEHAARMSAMTAASDATEELIERLELELNRARQGAITTEISEIVGGANALRENEG